MTVLFSIFNLSKLFIRFCAYLNVFYTELYWLTCTIPVILLWSYVKTGKELLLLNLESQNNLCWNASLEFSSQPPACSRANAWSNAGGLLLGALPSQNLEITKDRDSRQYNSAGTYFKSCKTKLTIGLKFWKLLLAEVSRRLAMYIHFYFQVGLTSLSNKPSPPTDFFRRGKASSVFKLLGLHFPRRTELFKVHVFS